MKKGMVNPWMVLGFLVLGLIAISMITGYLGIGEPRGDSTYTGTVVDVEHNRGFIFRTSQVMVKTDQRSSVAEEFCLPTEEKVQKAKEFLSSGDQITVQYNRPLYVNPFTCDSSLSVVRSMEVKN